MGCGSSIGTIAGGVGGFMLGGPAGAAVGMPLGGTAGSMIDGPQQTAAGEAAAAQQQIAQQQMDQWNRLYGPVEQNLSNYYSKVTPDQVTSLGLQNVQKEFQNQMKQTQKTMAQRGVGATTAGNQLMSGQRMDLAQSRANVRLTAPAQLRAEQMSFLATGKGAQTNAYNSMTSALGAQGAAGAAYENQLNQGIGNLAQAGMQYYAMNPNMFSSTQLPSLGIGGSFTPITGGTI